MAAAKNGQRECAPAPHGADTRAAFIPADDLRAVDNERIEPAFCKQMTKHGRDRGLAACPGHGHELAPGEQFRKRRRTMDD